MTDKVESAREAFARQQWGDAYALLAAGGPLEADDLERLAVAAHCRPGRREHPGVGAGAPRVCSCSVIPTGRHGAQRGWPSASCSAATWRRRVAGSLAPRGSSTRQAIDCAARGYLQMPVFLETLGSGDAATAYELADEIVAVARRFDDKDLLALGVLGRGQASLALGETARGMSLLDEVMVAVAIRRGLAHPGGDRLLRGHRGVHGRVRPAAGGRVDRGAQPLVRGPARSRAVPRPVPRAPVAGACRRTASGRRRSPRWSGPGNGCPSRPIPRSGSPCTSRASSTGCGASWPRPSGRTGRPASTGREPAPGVALLRLEEGKVDAAVAAVRRMVEESRGQLTRPTMLAASVEIMLAAGDVDDGSVGRRRARHDRRRTSTHRSCMPWPPTRPVRCSSPRARRPRRSPSLRRACAGWRDLEMPYDAARARVQIGLACRALGDHDAADFEMDAARATFERLGARPDLARVERLLGRGRTRRGRRS